MALDMFELRFNAMKAMPCTKEGNETVATMDLIEAKYELSALNRLRAQCDISFDEALRHEATGLMARGQIIRLNDRMVKICRRGEIALQRRIDALTPAQHAERNAPDATAQILQAIHHREPKITKFNGEPQLWPAFRDLFMSEVHNRDDLEPVSKLTYLKNACVGKAASALGLWDHTSKSYNDAWELMQKRYDDPYKIVQGLVNMLFELPASKAETHDALNHIVDTVQSVLRQLTNASSRNQMATAKTELCLIHSVAEVAYAAAIVSKTSQRRRLSV